MQTLSLQLAACWKYSHSHSIMQPTAGLLQVRTTSQVPPAYPRVPAADPDPRGWATCLFGNVELRCPEGTQTGSHRQAPLCLGPATWVSRQFTLPMCLALYAVC